MARRRGALRGDDAAVRQRSGLAQRGAPVVGSDLEVLLQHEGGTGSEEGPMVEDDGGQRWEPTKRGLKRR
jgi:hypothetical protein